MTDTKTDTTRPPDLRRRVLRLIIAAHVIGLWLLLGAIFALKWRPLGTLDFVRMRVETIWTAPSEFGPGQR